jgi:hypothetical protein
MRLLPAAALAIVAAGLMLAPVDARVRVQQDASTVLAAARTALGGDALLNSITSMTVNGSATEDLGRVSLSKSVEISLQLPDKFLVTKRHTSYGPPGLGMDFTITRYDGFNGSNTLDAIISSGGPTPPFMPYPAAPKTPAELQAAAARRLRLQKEGFARLMLPLFASSPAALPLQFESSTQATVDKTIADVVSARTTDGTELRLYLDAVNHLPLKLTWMAEPIVTMTTSSIVTTTSRGGVVSQSPPSAPMLPPPSPASLTPVEWAVTFSDFKTEAGLTWPRRFVTTMGGRKYEDMRLGKYRINPQIKPHVFEPKK